MPAHAKLPPDHDRLRGRTFFHLDAASIAAFIAIAARSSSFRATLEISIAQPAPRRWRALSGPARKPRNFRSAAHPMCVDYATFQVASLEAIRRARKAGKTLEMRSLQRVTARLKLLLTTE